MSLTEVMDLLIGIFYNTGLMNLTWKLPIMWAIGGFFIYLAIVKKFEPLLLQFDLIEKR